MLTKRAPLIAAAPSPNLHVTAEDSSSVARGTAGRPALSIEDGGRGAPAVVLHWTGRESKALRLAMRLSQRAFGALLGVSLPTVARWELGRAAVSPYGQKALDAQLRDTADDVIERFEGLLKETDAAITAHGSGKGRRV